MHSVPNFERIQKPLTYIQNPEKFPFPNFQQNKTFNLFFSFEFSNFLMPPKGPPFIFKNLLQQIGFSKSRNGPPFTGLKF